ncbi:MAG: hypothetical protein ACOYEV_09925 [Candidatus Nanopelagicales bacterium]
MRVLAFAPSLTAEEAIDGGLNMRGFPMTSAFVDVLPVEITVSVVIAVATLAGIENNPALYLGVNSPQGRRLVTMQMAWQWDDVPDVLVKFRSFLQYLPIHVETEGVYTLGLYDDPDATESEHTFPLAIFRNPNPGGI